MRIFLFWYRDQGNGQQAADHQSEVQQKKDVFPTAEWPCQDEKEANEKWDFLLLMYGVNAVTHYTTQEDLE